jgi:hypothetical protein
MKPITTLLGATLAWSLLFTSAAGCGVESEATQDPRGPVRGPGGGGTDADGGGVKPGEDPVPPGPRCGDGNVDPGEECDDKSACCTAECKVVAPGVVTPLGELGAGTYGRATLLPDGSLFGTFETGVDGELGIVSTISKDEGRTWTRTGTVVTEPATPGRTLGIPSVVRLADGTLLVAFRHHDPGAAGVTNFRLLVSASTDGGKSWSFRGEIQVYGSAKDGLWEPFLYVTPKGTLQAYYARERDNYRSQDIVVRSSKDGGKTWGSEAIAATTDGSRDGMPGVTALPDGSLVAVFESARQPGVNNNFVVRGVQSSDDGKTWTNRHIIFAPKNAARHAGAPQVTSLRDGRVVVSFMTNDGVNTTAAWPGGAETRIVVSKTAAFRSVAWEPTTTTVAAAASYWPGLVIGGTLDPIVLFKRGPVASAAVCLPPAPAP